MQRRLRQRLLSTLTVLCMILSPLVSGAGTARAAGDDGGVPAPTAPAPAESTAPHALAADTLAWPLDGAPGSFKSALSSDFGFRQVSSGTKYHFAIDIPVANGSTVKAAAKGKVIRVATGGTYATSGTQYVAVYHETLGITTVYMHLHSASVKLNDEVEAGDEVGTSGPDCCYPAHLDFRVLTGSQASSSSASSYNNPTKYFASLDTGAPRIPSGALKVREGTSGGYKAPDTLYKTDANGNKYIEIDENDIWVRLLVEADDKDIDDVRAVLQVNGGGETELHRFNYYAGTSSNNDTMPVETNPATSTKKAYVHSLGTSQNAPAKDEFYVKVAKDEVPSDGKIHKVAFHVKDAFGNEVPVDQTQVPVKRKADYKIDVKPDKDEYTCCASPTFKVEVRDAKAEGNPLVDIDEEKEKIEATFQGKPATLSHTGKGTYDATTSEQMRDEGSYVLSVKITKKETGKNLGTGKGAAKAKRPPQEYYTDRCGRQQKKVWNPKTCQWEIPPNNQPCQPDDNAGLFSLAYPTAGNTGSAARVAVLQSGFADAMAGLLRQAGIDVDFVDSDFSPTIVNEYPALFIPSGGFAGLGKSTLMKDRLTQYVQAGGTLVVFTQPKGTDFGLLPGALEGYGYDEDIHCVYKSAGISVYGPPLAGQTEELLSINVDGFFTRVPDGATVLLRRTLTGMPIMVSYPVGEGQVLATTSYADMAAYMGQGSPAEQTLLRDLAVWSVNPGAEVTTTRSGAAPVTTTARVSNPTDVPAVSALVEFIAPDGGSQGETTLAAAVPAGGEATLNVPVAIDAAYEGGDVPPYGLWRLQVTLLDAGGNALTTIPGAGAFALTAFTGTPGGYRYSGEPYAITVTSEAEEYLPGQPVNFTFHVFNYSDTDRNFLATWGLPHHGLGWDQTVRQEIAVPAGSQGTFTYTLPAVRDLDRLRTILWLDGRAVARAERGFWMAYPSAGVTLAADKPVYVVDEPPVITVTAQNGISQPYTAAGTLKVTDSKGTEVASLPVSLDLPERASATVTVPLAAPLSYGTYRASLSLKAYDAFIGQGSAGFSVPQPQIKADVTLPVSPGAEAPLAFKLTNTGSVRVPAATLAVTLKNPAGAVVWSEQRDFSGAPSAAADYALTMARGPLMFGDYTLDWTVTAAGQTVTNGSRTLRSALAFEPAWSQPSYRIRETAHASVVVRNTGFWQLSPAVQFDVADAGFTANRQLELAAGASGQVEFDIPLPESLSAGSHKAEVTVSAGGSLNQRLVLTVPESQVADELGGAQLQAGDPIDLRLTNPGGVDTTASYLIRLLDEGGQVIVDQSGTQALTAGGSVPLTVVVPAGAAAGSYTLTVTGQDQGTERQFAYAHNLTIGGAAGTVTLATDREVYLETQPVTVAGEARVTAGAVPDGNLHLAIYATAPQAQQCTGPGDPVLTGSTLSAAAAPAPDPTKADSVHHRTAMERAADLTAEALSGWVGDGDPIPNPWYSYYPQMYNEYVDVAVDYDGYFTIGSVAGDPASTTDDTKVLIYGHAYPGTSYTTIRLNGVDGELQWNYNQIAGPVFDPETRSMTTTYQYGPLLIRQIETMVRTANDRADAVRIRYVVENTSTATQNVGLRLMLDTQLGYNDGAPFRTAGGSITQETEFLGSGIPDAFLVLDNLESPQIGAQGIVRTRGERTPDRLVFANWRHIYNTLWNFNVDTRYQLTSDSAIGYYWDPVALAPGQTLDLSTRYGSTGVSFGSGQLSTVISAPAGLHVPADNPFQVLAFTRNNTFDTARNVRLTLNLPPGLTLADESSATINLGDLPSRGEAQAAWMVRATGQRTGCLNYSITTTSDNLTGEDAVKSINVPDSLFQTGTGYLVWEKDVPVNTDLTQAYSELAANFLPGKYRAVATFRTATGQTLGQANDTFYVAADQTLVTLDSDKPVYRVGDTVTITGKVANLSVTDGAFTLVVKQGDDVLLTEPLQLAAGEEHSYTVTTTAGAEGSLVIQASAGLARTEETLPVTVPQVSYSIDAPAVVGRAPFPVTVHLQNTGLLPAQVNVALNGESRTFQLAAGAQASAVRTFTFAADGQIAVAITGDLTADALLPITQGEFATMTTAPADKYQEGPVAIPFHLANTGTLPTALTVHMVLGAEVFDRTYSLTPGAELDDTALFQPAAGQYTLTWQTNFEDGQATIQVVRPALNRLELSARLPDRIPGTAAVPVTLRNTGDNRVEGSVVVTTAWNQWSLPYALNPGESVDLTALIDTIGAAPGASLLTVDAVSGGDALAHAEQTVTVAGSSLSLAAEIPATVGAGTTQTFTARVSNTGDLTTDATVVLDLAGIASQKARVTVPAGGEVPVAFTVALPADLPAGPGTGNFTSDTAKAPFDFAITGITGTASLTADRPFYHPGETALLTLTAETQAAAGAAETLTARLSGPDGESLQTFPAGTNPTLEFLAVAGVSDTTLSYGLYGENGRSLYLSTYRLRSGAGDLVLYTDKPVYLPGETVQVTALALRPGTLTIQSPWLQAEQPVSGGETTFRFTLPSRMVRGTYQIDYAFDGVPGSAAFDVDAPSVSIRQVDLNAATYGPGDPVGATMAVEATADFTEVTMQWWIESPDGQNLTGLQKVVDLPAGASSIDLDSVVLQPIFAGTHGFHFKVSDNSGLTLAEGVERFDVSGSVILGVAAARSAYWEGQPVLVNVALQGQGEGTLNLRIDGQTVSDNAVLLAGYQVLPVPAGALPAGTHRIDARLTADGLVSTGQAWVEIRPLPTVEIQVSGEVGQGAGFTISLVPSLPGSQVHFRWDNQPWTLDYGQVITLPAGSTGQLMAYAQIDGVSGPTAVRRVAAVDKTPPTITVTEPRAADYLHSGSIQPAFTVTDDGSGVDDRATQVRLDGQAISDVRLITLYPLSLGDHTLTVTAADKAGNLAEASVKFRVIATIASTRADTETARKLGQIDSDDILHSLQVKLDAAQAALNRGETKTAINNLQSFIHEAQAQRGKHVQAWAADMLIADARWVIQSLQ